MVDAAPGRRGLPRAFAMLASTAFSLLIHGAVLAAVVTWIEADPGAVAPKTDAVSVELIQTEVLEAVAAAPSVEAETAPESVQSDPGESVDSASASVSPTEQLKPVDPAENVVAQEVAARSEASSPAGLEVLQGMLASEDAVGSQVPAERPAAKSVEVTRKAKQREKPVKTAKLPDPAEKRDTESPSRKKGSASSRAAKGSAASAARVSASKGSAVNYAAIVRARVAARKPAGGGMRGTVFVAFGVSRSGSVSYVRVARSSGNPGLDGKVVAAVRGAGPFPMPPPGANLRFAMPFSFR
ncbi:energy transducer TonB [Hyphomicrobium sp. CS1GBMeth3]|uniref:energy transducer TonB family protein n=1 Tax=Hyphomicrobium sp. CS1GBMeth3 TaxID=1892845 RepID=UPI000930737E|nr:energy transducer TonB [Hyphomicrobium sp. CS1GBMeth3]